MPEHPHAETHQHWILDELPTGYALFQQITHPKDAPPGSAGGASKSKLRLDRFIFGAFTLPATRIST